MEGTNSLVEHFCLMYICMNVLFYICVWTDSNNNETLIKLEPLVYIPELSALYRKKEKNGWTVQQQ